MTLNDLLSPAFDPDPSLFTSPGPTDPTRPDPTRRDSPPTAPASPGSTIAPAPSGRVDVTITPGPGLYDAPHGAGVVAWIAAVSVSTVIALACLAASYVGSGVAAMIVGVP